MGITMKDVVRSAAERLQLDELTEEGALEPNAQLSIDAERERDALLACANTVYREAATEFCPIATSEICESSGVIEYDALSRPCLKVLRVEDLSGRKVRAKPTPAGIRTGEGTFRIFYCYLPQPAALDEELAFDSYGISADVLAAGTSAEYLLRNGMYQEADAWERRYREGISALCATGGRYVPERQFMM